MSTTSIEASLKARKVNTGWANRVQTERIIKQESMVCPVWGGVDSHGREVHKDTAMTTTAGCHLPNERVDVENAHRPNIVSHLGSAPGHSAVKKSYTY